MIVVKTIIVVSEPVTDTFGEWRLPKFVFDISMTAPEARYAWSIERRQFAVDRFTEWLSRMPPVDHFILRPEMTIQDVADTCSTLRVTARGIFELTLDEQKTFEMFKYVDGYSNVETVR